MRCPPATGQRLVVGVGRWVSPGAVGVLARRVDAGTVVGFAVVGLAAVGLAVTVAAGTGVPVDEGTGALGVRSGSAEVARTGTALPVPAGGMSPDEGTAARLTAVAGSLAKPWVGAAVRGRNGASMVGPPSAALSRSPT